MNVRHFAIVTSAFCLLAYSYHHSAITFRPLLSKDWKNNEYCPRSKDLGDHLFERKITKILCGT